MPGRDRCDGPLRLRAALAAVVAALAMLGLALPAVASAAVEFPLEVETLGDGEGTVGCKVAPATTFEECAPFEEFASGATVTLSVQPLAGFGPEEGSVFKGWGGACSGTAATCQVTMSGPRTVSATFDLERFKLKVQKTGSGVVECADEINAPDVCAAEAEYPVGDPVTLTAEAEEGWEFAGWTLEGGEFGAAANCEEPEEAECELTIEENTTVRAVFVRWPALNLEAKGSGAGSFECAVEGGLPEECEESYPRDTGVVLLAAAGEESEFTGWGGACAAFGTEAECELTMEGPRSVSATFESTALHTLTIEVSGPGTVSGSPGSIDCSATCAAKFRLGTKVTLSAAAAPGSLFGGWAGGGCRGVATTCTVTVGGDMTVAAEFEPKPPPDPPEIEIEEGTLEVGSTAKVKAGKAALKLSCSGGPCAGTLTLAAKIRQGRKLKSVAAGSAPVKLADGASKTVAVKLSGPVKQELAKGHSVKAKLSGAGLAGAAVTLLPPKPPKRH